MKKFYDVVIIGSGVVGSSIAYHLSEKRNKEILVMDKGFPLSGTSGSTQAWVWVHNKVPSWYGQLSMYSAELYPFLKKKIGDVEYKRTGGIAPFFDENDRLHALRLAEKQAEVGIEMKVLDREEVLEKEPNLSPDIVGATYSKIDGNVNPFRLVELFIKAARKNGVEFSFYNTIIGIEKTSGLFKISTLNGESYLADKVIIASGPWTKEVGKLLGIHIPVKLVRGQVIVTEPVAPLIRNTIAGVRQADNGEVLVGYSKENVGYDRRTTLDVIQETAKMAINYIPKLANANVVRCFSGIRVIPEDGFPIIGEIPSINNAYVAVMHSGITLSPLTGTLMTELINEGEASLDLSKLNLGRFEKTKSTTVF